MSVLGGSVTVRRRRTAAIRLEEAPTITLTAIIASVGRGLWATPTASSAPPPCACLSSPFFSSVADDDAW